MDINIIRYIRRRTLNKRLFRLYPFHMHTLEYAFYDIYIYNYELVCHTDQFTLLRVVIEYDLLLLIRARIIYTLVNLSLIHI